MTREPASSRPPDGVVILGAGTMGAGMAIAFARVGTTVQLTSRRQASVERAARQVETSLRLLRDHGLIEASDVPDIQRRMSMTTSFDELSFDVELVVETIAEDPVAKRDLLERAEERSNRETVIVTNTSSLSLSDLSAGLRRPENFAGFHWFNPPELVELVEVVAGPRTSESTVDRLVAWSSAAGRRPVVLRREIDGFVANRLQYALLREAYSLVTGGVCRIEDVDRVMTACLGPRWAAVGPFESVDLAGLDVHLEVGRRLFPLLSTDTEPPPMLADLVDDGALGAKSGRGLYGSYDPQQVRRLVERRISVLLAVAEARRGDGGGMRSRP